MRVGGGGFESKTSPLPLVLTCDRLDFNEATWTPCDVLWRKARRRGKEGADPQLAPRVRHAAATPVTPASPLLPLAPCRSFEPHRLSGLL